MTPGGGQGQGEVGRPHCICFCIFQYAQLQSGSAVVDERLRRSSSRLRSAREPSSKNPRMDPVAQLEYYRQQLALLQRVKNPGADVAALRLNIREAIQLLEEDLKPAQASAPAGGSFPRTCTCTNDTRTHARAYTHTLSLSHTHTHTLSLILSLSLSLLLSLILSLTHTHKARCACVCKRKLSTCTGTFEQLNVA